MGRRGFFRMGRLKPYTAHFPFRRYYRVASGRTKCFSAFSEMYYPLRFASLQVRNSVSWLGKRRSGRNYFVGLHGGSPTKSGRPPRPNHTSPFPSGLCCDPRHRMKSVNHATIRNLGRHR